MMPLDVEGVLTQNIEKDLQNLIPTAINLLTQFFICIFLIVNILASFFGLLTLNFIILG